MVSFSSDRSSAPVGCRQMGTLALAGVLGFAAFGGAMQGKARFDSRTGISPAAATDMQAAAQPEWDLPNLDHERVDFFVRQFSTSQRDAFAEYLARSGRYVPMISEKLEQRGMPRDLIYLSMIESGFKPTAYSSAKASGLWQFIEETGERYGLRVGRGIDERNDPEKSTDAALTYLAELHHRFGSWYLAAAAYNTGEGRVSRIMREETGSERGTEMDYYRIWDRLPRETRDYVPLMVAAARISKDPARYGFGEVEVEAPLASESVPVDGGTPLAAVAEAAGTDRETLERLNPQLTAARTPVEGRTLVRLPAGTRTAFLLRWPEVRERATLATTPYRVRRGDSLLAIALEFGVSADRIRDENGIRGDRIRAGETLRIPARG